ncbi:MAG TPA: DUF3047 domain-containing protein [Burkholderiaceae bacterium]|nr:DUF3047 domain-containing protein [Burkholderiaceae bacterium]
MGAIGGCATHRGSTPSDAAAQRAEREQALALFSAHPPGALPSAWQPLIITRAKKPTEYRLVADGGVTVLHAHAAASASLLMHALDLEPDQQPWLAWQWKVDRHIKGADNRYRDTEDAPVRIVLAFDGDKGDLPFSEQILFETGRLVTGRELPYATLMYIWEKKAPVGSVIAHTRTSQLKMVVAASGPHGLGQWRQLSRNLVDDYQRAFGKKPGRLIGVGVMSDTDNTGDTVDAWYGDIRLLRQQK